jgi:hypothetical protein
MKRHVSAMAITLTGLTVLLSAANADARQLRAKDAWCLETSNGSGGGTRFECGYETMAQCMESKVAHGDHCSRNTRG